jgi:hypothetical protein
MSKPEHLLHDGVTADVTPSRRVKRDIRLVGGIVLKSVVVPSPIPHSTAPSERLRYCDLVFHFYE